MEKVLSKFNQTISYILLVTGMIFTAFQTLELIWEIVKGFINRFNQSGMDFVPHYFKPVAVLFFNILLLLEIQETIRVFDKEHEVKMKVIIIVCLIAVSRKVLAMDAEKSDPVGELAVAALILAFSISYYLLKKSNPLAKD